MVFLSVALISIQLNLISVERIDCIGLHRPRQECAWKPICGSPAGRKFPFLLSGRASLGCGAWGYNNSCDYPFKSVQTFSVFNNSNSAIFVEAAIKILLDSCMLICKYLVKDCLRVWTAGWWIIQDTLFLSLTVSITNTFVWVRIPPLDIDRGGFFFSFWLLQQNSVDYLSEYQLWLSLRESICFLKTFWVQ